jgi:hypothetical protein
MMPYITSQFMPRKVSDRPKVIPNGCVNLAFMGQFVELPLDVVFTVETSVRTALMAVWGLTGLQKPMVPVYEPAFDLRVIVANLKASLGIDEKLAVDPSAHPALGPFGQAPRETAQEPAQASDMIGTSTSGLPPSIRMQLISRGANEGRQAFAAKESGDHRSGRRPGTGAAQ